MQQEKLGLAWPSFLKRQKYETVSSTIYPVKDKFTALNEIFDSFVDENKIPLECDTLPPVIACEIRERYPEYIETSSTRRARAVRECGGMLSLTRRLRLESSIILGVRNASANVQPLDNLSSSERALLFYSRGLGPSVNPRSPDRAASLGNAEPGPSSPSPPSSRRPSARQEYALAQAELALHHSKKRYEGGAEGGGLRGDIGSYRCAAVAHVACCGKRRGLATILDADNDGPEIVRQVGWPTPAQIYQRMASSTTVNVAKAEKKPRRNLMAFTKLLILRRKHAEPPDADEEKNA